MSDLCRARIETEQYSQPSSGEFYVELDISGQPGPVRAALQYEPPEFLDGAWAYTWAPCGATVRARNVLASPWSNEITATVAEPTMAAMSAVGLVLVGLLHRRRRCRKRS